MIDMCHCPTGLTLQGLTDTFMVLQIPFDSPEGHLLNQQIFKIIYHAAVKTSCEMAQVQGTPLKAYKPRTVQGATISIVSLGWLFNLFAVRLGNGLA